MLDEIQGDRKSNGVMNVVMVFNAILTAIFAYNHLGGVFGTLTGRGNDDILVRIVAAVFTVLVFDGAFHAWASISRRSNLSLPQIATSSTAKMVAMGGSLTASLGQIVLGQTAVVLPEGIVFVVAVVAMGAVGIIALLHVYWWDKFRGESFESTERDFMAKQDATVQGNVQTQAEQRGKMEIDHQNNQHTIQMERMKMNNELALTKMAAEQDLEKELAMQEIAHQKQVAEQTRELLTQSVHGSAAKIAAVKAARLQREFIDRQGVGIDEMDTPALFQSPRVNKQTMAADGVQKGSVIHKVVTDAAGNIISEEELPDLYAPVKPTNEELAHMSRVVHSPVSGIELSRYGENDTVSYADVRDGAVDVNRLNRTQKWEILEGGFMSAAELGLGDTDPKA